MLESKMKIYGNEGKTSVFVSPLLKLFEHGFKEPREEIHARVMGGLKSGWTLELPFNLEIHVTIIAIEGATSQYQTLHVLITNSLLSVF